MIIQLANVSTQNIIFFTLLALAILLTLRQKKDQTVMSIDSTNELKGLAILAIIFVHVAYALVNDNHFLSPLSNWSGVGVNIFFFLSGFGLTLSALRVKPTEAGHAPGKKDLSIKNFYLKRLSKVLIPLWISLIIFLILDKLFLNLSYPVATITKAFLGFYPRANLYLDINSPLWFITPIVFYYLLFPLLFRKRVPELAALAFYIIAYYVLGYFLPREVDWGVKSLWSLHYLAFPLGIIFASILNRLNEKNIIEKIQKTKYVSILKYFILIILISFWYYFFKNSGVGSENKMTEQLISLLSLLITVFIFILKPIESRFLIWLGVFSYEIYLLHWPLMYRYDFLFQFLPAGISLFLYLIIFLGTGFIFKILKKTFQNKS